MTYFYQYPTLGIEMPKIRRCHEKDTGSCTGPSADELYRPGRILDSASTHPPLAIYIDSYLFVIATAVLQHSLGVNSSYGICGARFALSPP
ncbi:hypothetical protein GGI42DRAFT_89963 [Trichoderma sp. SZMC 28013]